MPLTHSIDKKQRLVKTVGSGTITFTETKRHQDALLTDPDFDPRFDQLIDLTAVTALNLSFDEARTLSRRNVFSPTSRRAFVSPAGGVLGVGSFMDAYASRTATRTDIFTDVPAALSWLGLSPSYR